MTPSRFRWFVVFLLFAITVVNYIDRAAIAAVTALPRFAGDPPPGWKTSDADGIRALGAFSIW